MWLLSPAAVQKYPIFLGLMFWLPVKGGLSRGGVGTCKIGKGGALVERGSVTPGMDGMRGGRERALAVPARSAEKRVVECILSRFEVANESERVGGDAGAVERL